MKNDIANLHVALNHTAPKKPQLSPHLSWEIKYNTKVQHTHEEDMSNPLDLARIQRVQEMLKALLCMGQAVNNKMLVALSIIGTYQASTTEDTIKSIHQLMNYCATYPDNGIMYQSSNIILLPHPDTNFSNDTRSRSQADAHIFSQRTTTSPVGMDLSSQSPR